MRRGPAGFTRTDCARHQRIGAHHRADAGRDRHGDADVQRSGHVGARAGHEEGPVRKTPTRKPPQYGYQCRDGDELKYDVCAGHKAWVDGQREFTDCLDGGGTWDQVAQRCIRP